MLRTITPAVEQTVCDSCQALVTNPLTDNTLTTTLKGNVAVKIVVGGHRGIGIPASKGKPVLCTSCTELALQNLTASVATAPVTSSPAPVAS